MTQSSSGYVPFETREQKAKASPRTLPEMARWALSPARAEALRELDILASIFDDRFKVPGTDFRFGLDGVLGLLPGVGDTVTAGISGYLIVKARQLGVRKRVTVKMLGNVFVDWLLGLIPLVGDIFDFAHKANRKNIDLLRNELLMGQK